MEIEGLFTEHDLLEAQELQMQDLHQVRQALFQILPELKQEELPIQQAPPLEDFLQVKIQEWPAENSELLKMITIILDEAGLEQSEM